MSLRWGILGAGNISGQFVEDLVRSNGQNCKRHVVVSVGCSDVGRGKAFLQTHGVTSNNNQGTVPIAQSYDEFFQNPDIDIVYIGTPHTCHKEQVLRALRCGKHVLCEKPFTVTGKDAHDVWAEAKQRGLFVMEAVWTRFFPLVTYARRLLHQQRVIGDVHRMTADFSMAADVYELPKTSRARDIGLAAGATMDIGVYPLTYMRALLAEPSNAEFEVKSFLTLDPEDHVDHVATYIVKYDDGKHAVLTSSNHVDGPSPFLRVEGTQGTLEMYANNPAQPRRLRVTFRSGEPDLEIDDDTVASGYSGFIYEADAVAAAIEAGHTECEVMPWSETQLMMDTMDKIRWENNLFYAEDSM